MVYCYSIMRLQHDGPPDVHPWDLHDVGVPPQRPFPPVIPLLLENQFPIDTKVDRALPPGTVHNGFVPPEHWMPVLIMQPNPQSGNRQGKRG